jgi:hypothetical protein
MNGDRLDPPLAWALIGHRRLPAAPLLLRECCREQSVEVLIIKMLYRIRQIGG